MSHNSQRRELYSPHSTGLLRQARQSAPSPPVGQPGLQEIGRGRPEGSGTDGRLPRVHLHRDAGTHRRNSLKTSATVAVGTMVAVHSSPTVSKLNAADSPAVDESSELTALASIRVVCRKAVACLLLLSCVSVCGATDRHVEWRSGLPAVGERVAELPLSVEGVTDYRIVLGATATTMDQKAAEDLARWLGEMTGAKFVVVREADAFEPTGREISIGHTRLLHDSGLKLAKQDLSRDGYGIGVKGQQLFIVGGSQRGIINGVYSLLEEDLDCRWYAPGTQSIPRRETLKFSPAVRSYVPALEDRRDPYNTDTMRDVDWSLRNKTLGAWAAVPVEWGGHPGWPGVHTITIYVPPSLFPEHPEYFALVGGVRNAGQPCLTNPDVLAMTIEKARNRLKDDPTMRLLDISLNDYGPWSYCMCANCRAIAEAEGSYMGTLLRYINSVADAIKDDYPAVKITTLAYQGTVMPPRTFGPRRNVIPRLCTDARWGAGTNVPVEEIESLDKAFKAWSALGAKLSVWDYPTSFAYLSINCNMPVYQGNLQYYIRHGVTGVMYETGNTASDHSFMNSWIAAKQMWDPSRDTRTLIRDFNYGYYRVAAPYMQEYDDMLWAAWGKWREDRATNPVDKAFVARGWELMKKAEALAAGDEVLTKRIKTAQLPLMFAMLERGPGSDFDGYNALLGRFETIARDAGMSYVTIDASGPNLSRYLDKWRGLAKPVAVLSPNKPAAKQDSAVVVGYGYRGKVYLQRFGGGFVADGTPILVADADDAQSAPSLAWDRDGAFHLVWCSSASGQSRLHYARSGDGGRTWQQVVVKHSGQAQSQPDVALEEGRVHLAWVEGKELMYATASANTPQFESLRVDETPHTFAAPAIATTGQAVCIVYQHLGVVGDLRQVVSADRRQFSAPTVWGTPPATVGTNMFPVLIATDRNNLHGFFADALGVRQRSSTDAGQTWSPIGTVASRSDAPLLGVWAAASKGKTSVYLAQGQGSELQIRHIILGAKPDQVIADQVQQFGRTPKWLLAEGDQHVLLSADESTIVFSRRNNDRWNEVRFQVVDPTR